MKSLLSSCTRMAVPPTGPSVEGSGPPPVHVLPELTRAQTWLCLLPTHTEPEPLAVVALGCLSLLNLGCPKSRIPDISENTCFDGSTNVLHHLIFIFIFFKSICVFKSYLSSPFCFYNGLPVQ